MTSFLQERRSEKGFSLIELIVVLVILGLLAAVVAPRVYDKLARGKEQIAKSRSRSWKALSSYSLSMSGVIPPRAKGWRR